MSLSIPFSNAYAQLPEQCFARVLPTPVKNPLLIAFNQPLADQLGINYSAATEQELAGVFAGNEIPAGALPLAMAYCGHQFGQLNPQLGDGRAILLGDLEDTNGQRRDIQLKGSGRTPFSRSGDGRSPLGPALREYILCEAMQALGVPTTRALALVASGEYVIRDGREPGAVFTRVASSHIRVGTFQFFALRRDHDALQALAQHVIARHYPHIDASADDAVLQLFKAICQRQAELIAQWMSLGFIHGVMNTDNMTISGETIDYGPCAFMEAFNPAMVFSSIDRQGRYAYQNQPAIGQWNLARLAEALLPLFPGDEQQAVEDATAVLHDYSDQHQRAWEQRMNRKLGLNDVEPGDRERIEALLNILEQGRMDYTGFFRQLSHISRADAERAPLFALLQHSDCRNTAAVNEALHEWLSEWQAELAQRNDHAAELMLATNPAVIPRNHKVQEAIMAAEEGDFAPFQTLLEKVTDPFVENAEDLSYQCPAEPHEKVLRTFCGT